MFRSRQHHGCENTRNHSNNGKAAPNKAVKTKSTKKSIHFPTTVAAAIQRHQYSFDWEHERSYWYSREELNGFKAARLEDVGALRKVLGIEVASRDDADTLTTSVRDLFIHDKITFAFDLGDVDDVDDDHDISIQGIEHMVFPVLQKEMVGQRKELRGSVLGHARDPGRRKKDPQGLRLADESAAHSAWARDVAAERGMKYTQMKRGKGRGGGLLAMTHTMKTGRACRQFSGLRGDAAAAADTLAAKASAAPRRATALPRQLAKASAVPRRGSML